MAEALNTPFLPCTFGQAFMHLSICSTIQDTLFGSLLWADLGLDAQNTKMKGFNLSLLSAQQGDKWTTPGWSLPQEWGREQEECRGAGQSWLQVSGETSHSYRMPHLQLLDLTPLLPPAWGEDKYPVTNLRLPPMLGFFHSYPTF